MRNTFRNIDQAIAYGKQFGVEAIRNKNPRDKRFWFCFSQNANVTEFFNAREYANVPVGLLDAKQMKLVMWKFACIMAQNAENAALIAEVV